MAGGATKVGIGTGLLSMLGPTATPALRAAPARSVPRIGPCRAAVQSRGSQVAVMHLETLPGATRGSAAPPLDCFPHDRHAFSLDAVGV